MNWRAIVLFLGLAVFGACSADSGTNQPPVVVLNVSSEVQVIVGETLSIEISANDPEGGALTFDYEARPEGAWTLSSAQFLKSATGARFDWAPLASDVTGTDPLRLIFIVRDDAGQVTEKTVNVNIVPGNGVPRFLTNSSVLYDPRIGKPVVVDLRVRDDDSTEVEIVMDEASAPFGASFTQNGPFEGTLTWQPDAEQLKKRVHSINFVADDLQNEVSFKLTVVIRSPTNVNLQPDQIDLSCPGEEIITHSPIGPQRGFNDYEFTATLSQAARSRYDEVYLYWTLGDPYSDSDDPRDGFEGILMEDEGTQFFARIGNQADVIPEGGSVSVSYTICAIDVDSSDSEAVRCVPSTGDYNLYHSFVAYHPDEEAECIDDGGDLVGAGNDDFENATPISTTGFNFFRTCSGNDDYHTLTVRPGERYLVAAVYNQNSDVQVQAFDAAQSTIETEKSTCTGLSGIEAAVPEDGTQTTFFIRVNGGDNHNYAVRALLIDSGSGSECSDAANEPNETAGNATPLTDGQTVSAEICTAQDIDIYKIGLTAGQTVSFNNQFQNSQGNLDMTLFAPSQAGEISVSGSGVAFTFSFGNEETLEHQATETGDYYLLVFNNNQSAVPYTLNVSVGAGPSCTDDDQYSTNGNHSQASAALIPNSEFVEISGKACPGQPDFYRRTEFRSAAVLAELTLDGGDADLSDVTVSVYDISGTLVAEGTVVGSGITLDFTPNPPSSLGDFLYKVESSQYVEYTFAILRE